MAPFRRARRHVGRDLKIGEPGPYTGLIYAEDGEVLRLDGRDIGFVCDGESASSQIIKALEKSEMTTSCRKCEVRLTVAVTKISYGAGLDVNRCAHCGLRPRASSGRDCHLA